MLKSNYLAIFLTLFLVLIAGRLFSLFFLKLSRFFKIYDIPELAPNRKDQKAPVPLIGGLSIILNALFFCLMLYFFTFGSFDSFFLEFKNLLGSVFKPDFQTADFFGLSFFGKYSGDSFLQNFQNILRNEFQSGFVLYKINFFGILFGLIMVTLSGFLDDLGIFDRRTRLNLKWIDFRWFDLKTLFSKKQSKNTEHAEQSPNLKSTNLQNTTFQNSILQSLDPKNEILENKPNGKMQVEKENQLTKQEVSFYIPKVSKFYYFLSLFFGIIAIVIWGNLRIEVLSYPFDYITFSGFAGYILPIFWLGFCLMTTKFIDGSDGLCSSIALVCFLTIASTSAMNHINQPFTFTLSLIWAFSCIPFLYQNFPNARQYLGESGSTVLGLTVGILSILSGAKVATTSMVLGWFLWDILLVIISRSIVYKSFKKGLTQGDNTSHWHHRLKKTGMNKIQVLVFTLVLIVIFAQMILFSAIFYPSFSGSYQKLLPLVFQFCWLAIVFYLKTKREFSLSSPQSKIQS